MSDTIQLEYPVISGGQEVTEVTLQRPKAKHLKGIQLSNIGMDELLVLAGKLSGLTSNIIDELDIIDVNKIIKRITDFL